VISRLRTRTRLIVKNVMSHNAKSDLFSSLTFRFTPVASVCVLLSLIILMTLGTWQLHRRAWKLELIEAVATRSNGEAEPLEVIVSGKLVHKHEIHVFGTIGPKPGYFIFTPLSPGTDKSDALTMVNRGFVPEQMKSPTTRADGQTDGMLTIVGLFREAERKPAPAKWFSLPNRPDENIWHIRDPQKFITVPGFQTSAPDWYIDSLGEENTASLPAGDTTKIEFNNRHMEYALTWYGLGATLLGVWLAWSIRRK